MGKMAIKFTKRYILVEPLIFAGKDIVLNVDGNFYFGSGNIVSKEGDIYLTVKGNLDIGGSILAANGNIYIECGSVCSKKVIRMKAMKKIFIKAKEKIAWEETLCMLKMYGESVYIESGERIDIKQK